MTTLEQERRTKRLAKLMAKRKRWQQQYRARKAKVGLVRYELEVPQVLKTQLEAMAELLSDEMDESLPYRQRIAAARRQLFADGINGDVQAYTTLREKITALESEVTHLSPAFFNSKAPSPKALPEAIVRLPDEPASLKTLLAQFYQRALQAERNLQDSDSRASRYLDLYEVQSNENQRLRQQIKSLGGTVDELTIEDNEEAVYH